MLKPDMMLEATRLTRAGQLTEATALLQRMFRGETARDMSAGRASDAALSRLIIDEAIEETDPPLFGTATSPCRTGPVCYAGFSTTSGAAPI